MRKFIIVFIISIIFIMLICFFLLNNTNYKENFNSEIVISNDEIILEKLKSSSLKTEDTYVEETTDEEVIDKIFTNKVLKEECINRNIELDDSELASLKNMTEVNSISDEFLEKIEGDLGMTETEFREYMYNELVELKKRSKLENQLLSEINNENISIDNEELKEKIKEFNKSKNIDEETLTELQELLNEYIELIKENYVFTVQ